MSRVFFRSDLPSLSMLGTHPVLIYDRVLAARVPGFRAWAEKFPVSYPVSAGEKLKDVRNFAREISRIVELTRDLPREEMTIVAAGGGSVGDFAGFVASVLKRGVGLVQVPSTWLSAIDSAHGGKTALNVGGFKNPIGTFYPASKVFIVRDVLRGQPEKRVHEAFGELAKIALIDGGPWVKKLSQAQLGPKRTEADLLWDFLKPAIAAKLRVVARDPQERSGARAVLNLGHTLGHVLEAHHRVPHGEAVAQGLIFALEWSARRNVLKKGEDEAIVQWLASRFGIVSRAGEWSGIPRQRFLELLRQDKKRDASESVRFIFLAGAGKARRMSVRLDDLANEAKRQGWVR